MKVISTYLIWGKNDRVVGVAARGVGTPEVEAMLKQEDVFAFDNASKILIKGNIFG